MAVELRVEIDYACLQFAYRVGTTQWTWVPQQFDASIVSDEATAPGLPNFTGAFVGVACQDMSGARCPADFVWFEYVERRVESEENTMRWDVAVAGIVLVSTGAHQDALLKDLMPSGMVVGVAINQRQFEGTDAAAVDLITKQFNQISPENVLKFQSTQPAADRYTFDAADRYVQFGLDRHMQVVGHNLVWHSQTGAWVFQGADGKSVDRDTLLARMRDHIHAVVGRYKGKIHGWDVVNDAIDGDGSMRKSPWELGIGDDYVAKAFEFAHEADPDAELYYNDFNLEKPAKRAGVIKLVKDLQARKLRIDGIGNQAHWRLETPSVAEIDEALVDLHSTGLKVMYSELDINLLPNTPRGADPAVANPYADGLPDAVQQQLARRYADVFGVFVKHRDAVTRVTFLGLSDADSWLNRGRMNYPLLWDRQRRPKPAFDAVVEVLRNARQR